MNVAEKLYNILNTKFSNSKIKTFTSNGKETMNMEEIRMFSFDFLSDYKNYGPVVILFSSNKNLEIYYGDNTSKTLDSSAKNKWEDFIEHMSIFARSNRLGFSLKHITSLKYDLNNIANLEESYKNIFEGYYGTSKTSYNKQGNARIIIKHTKAIGEDDARFRNINAIYVENSSGERFKLPFIKLSGARAMARHVTEGGNPYDLFGIHISEMVKDINTLGSFLRRSGISENEEAAKLVDIAKEHYDGMRKSLKQIAGKRGYGKYKENWEPSEISSKDMDVTNIRQIFMDDKLNSKIEDALPLLQYLQELQQKEEVKPQKEMKELGEFSEWVNKIDEDIRTLPETDRQLKDLVSWLSQPRPLGVNGINVINTLTNVLNDDDLYDSFIVASQEDPEADARPLVIKWMGGLLNQGLITDPVIIKNLRNAVVSMKEGVDIDIDADTETQLNANINKERDQHRKPKRIIP